MDPPTRRERDDARHDARHHMDMEETTTDMTREPQKKPSSEWTNVASASSPTWTWSGALARDPMDGCKASSGFTLKRKQITREKQEGKNLSFGGLGLLVWGLGLFGGWIGILPFTFGVWGLGLGVGIFLRQHVDLPQWLWVAAPTSISTFPQCTVQYIRQSTPA